jgi:hypothetical protein
MAHGTWHVALLGPTAIAIHDDGNVLGQGVWGLQSQKLNTLLSVAGTLPLITLKQSFALSNENDKSNAFHPSNFVQD